MFCLRLRIPQDNPCSREVTLFMQQLLKQQTKGLTEHHLVQTSPSKLLGMIWHSILPISKASTMPLAIHYEAHAVEASRLPNCHQCSWHLLWDHLNGSLWASCWIVQFESRSELFSDGGCCTTSYDFAASPRCTKELVHGGKTIAAELLVFQFASTTFQKR